MFISSITCTCSSLASIAVLFPQDLRIKDGTCEVEICLSGDQHSEWNPKPAHPVVMMRKLYDDTLYQDVSFLFDGGTDVSMDPGRALDGAQDCSGTMALLQDHA